MSYVMCDVLMSTRTDQGRSSLFEILRHGNGVKREDVVEREGSVVLFVNEVSSDQLLTVGSANYLSSQPELPATKQLPGRWSSAPPKRLTSRAPPRPVRGRRLRGRGKVRGEREPTLRG